MGPLKLERAVPMRGPVKAGKRVVIRLVSSNKISSLATSTSVNAVFRSPKRGIIPPFGSKDMPNQKVILRVLPTRFPVDWKPAVRLETLYDSGND